MEFLEAHHVLLRTWWCGSCGEECSIDQGRMSFVCFRRHTERDSRRRVTHSRCAYRQSMLTGSWFERVHMDIGDDCRFCCLWLTIAFPRQRFLERELSMSSHTVVDWSSFCREVCVYWVERGSQMLGGQGVIVEIDEAKLGKRKYDRGRWIDGTWVFGGFERGSKKCFLVPVPTRGSDVLLEVIKNWIRPGTTIMSDCWRAYDCLSSEGFVHATVNHSYNFVDPSTRAHTQNIERTWRDVRGGIPRFGRRQNHMVGYLAEFLFKRQFPDHRDRVHAFFIAIGELYPPIALCST